MKTFPLVATLAALLVAGAAQAETSGLKGLHDALGLSSSQEGAWKTFEAATASNGEAEARQRKAAELMPTLTAPRRVDLSIAMMQADLRTLETRGAAVKAFYATLTPAQRAVFDKQTAPQQQPRQQ